MPSLPGAEGPVGGSPPEEPEPGEPPEERRLEEPDPEDPDPEDPEEPDLDEPEPDPSSMLATQETGVPVAEAEAEPEDDQPEAISFDRMSEEELLAGIEGLVPPEKSDDF